MYYLIEAVIIGLYSVLIYIPLKFIFKNIYLLFFFTGFLKHFLGHFIGIHKLYCKLHNLEIINTYDLKKLLIFSILEGLIYLFGGVILNKIDKMDKINIFIFGFILHIVFEIIGIHESFLKNKCTA